MIARTIPIAIAFAALSSAPAMAQVQQQQQQQRTGALATIPLTADAVAAQIVGDSTMKAYTGTAKVALSLVPASKEVCYDIALTGIQNVAEARIHKAAKGENGPSVVSLALKTDTTATKDCAKVSDEVFADISENPANYYVQISTKDHPMGVVRGQLVKPPEE